MPWRMRLTAHAEGGEHLHKQGPRHDCSLDRGGAGPAHDEWASVEAAQPSHDAVAPTAEEAESSLAEPSEDTSSGGYFFKD